MPVDATTPPTSFSDAASREALRKMILDGALGRFDKDDGRHNDPIPHVIWNLLEQVETGERALEAAHDTLRRCHALAFTASDGEHPVDLAVDCDLKITIDGYREEWKHAKAVLAGVERQRDKAEQKLRDEMKLAHDLANRFSHASSALQIIAKDLGIDHKEPPASGWANPIWEGVRARKDALAAADGRASAAETLLRRIAKYAREDRAVTPGVTRLARALDEVDQLLAFSPPTPEAGEVKAPTSRWAAHCCATRLIPTFFDTREDAVEYLKKFECSPGEGHIVEHPSPPTAGEARGAGCDDCCGSGVAIDVILGGRVERPCPYYTKRSGT